MALDIAPGSLRSYFGFIGWRGHDRELWQRLVEEARARREATATQTHRPARLRQRCARRSRSDRELRAREAARLRALRAPRARSADAAERSADRSGRRPIRRTASASAIRSGCRRCTQLLGAEAARALRGLEGRGADRQSAAGESDRHQRAPQPHAVQRPHRMSAAALRRHAGGFSAARAGRRRMQPQMRARPGAQMFANRLRKNLKSAQDWAQREIDRLLSHLRRRHARVRVRHRSVRRRRRQSLGRRAGVRAAAHGRAEGRAPAARRSAGGDSARARHRRRSACSCASGASRRTARSTRSWHNEREYRHRARAAVPLRGELHRLPGHRPVSRSSPDASA